MHEMYHMERSLENQDDMWQACLCGVQLKQNVWMASFDNQVTCEVSLYHSANCINEWNHEWMNCWMIM